MNSFTKTVKIVTKEKPSPVWQVYTDIQYLRYEYNVSGIYLYMTKG